LRLRSWLAGRYFFRYNFWPRTTYSFLYIISILLLSVQV
jgi:hypothetical protein